MLFYLLQLNVAQFDRSEKWAFSVKSKTNVGLCVDFFFVLLGLMKSGHMHIKGSSSSKNCSMFDNSEILQESCEPTCCI